MLDRAHIIIATILSSTTACKRGTTTTTEQTTGLASTAALLWRFGSFDPGNTKPGTLDALCIVTSLGSDPGNFRLRIFKRSRAPNYLSTSPWIATEEEKWFSYGTDCDDHADVIVSPANSFGRMDGGIDLHYRNQLGLKVERRLRELIEKRYENGELPVGEALVVPTGHATIKRMIAAPTMRTPQNIRGPSTSAEPRLRPCARPRRCASLRS